MLKRLRFPLLFLLLLFAPFIAASTAHAAHAPNAKVDKSQDTNAVIGGDPYVYLGTVDNQGHFLDGKFTDLPDVRMTAAGPVSDVTLTTPILITARMGTMLRAAASPTARAVGRLPYRTKVKLLGLHCNSGGYVWGNIQLGQFREHARLDRDRSDTRADRIGHTTPMTAALDSHSSLDFRQSPRRL